MEIDRLVNSLLQSNTFVLSNDGEDEVCLVDIGDIDPVLNLLSGRKVGKLLLTHAHYDHVYGINELLANFPDCEIYGSSHTLKALKNDKLNFSYYYDRPLSYISGNEYHVEDFCSIKLWNDIYIYPLITPGHTPGSTCFFSKKDVFTGDAFIPNIITVTKFKECDKLLAAKSVEIIHASITDDMMVHPGHLCQYIKNNNIFHPLD